MELKTVYYGTISRWISAMTLQSYYDTFKFDVKFNKIYKLLKIYKVKFVSFIRVSFLAEKMECALKINNSNKV